MSAADRPGGARRDVRHSRVAVGPVVAGAVVWRFWRRCGASESGVGAALAVVDCVVDPHGRAAAGGGRPTAPAGRPPRPAGRPPRPAGRPRADRPARRPRGGVGRRRVGDAAASHGVRGVVPHPRPGSPPPRLCRRSCSPSTAPCADRPATRTGSRSAARPVASERHPRRGDQDGRDGSGRRPRLSGPVTAPVGGADAAGPLRPVGPARTSGVAAGDVAPRVRAAGAVRGDRLLAAAPSTTAAPLRAPSRRCCTGRGRRHSESRPTGSTRSRSASAARTTRLAWPSCTGTSGCCRSTAGPAPTACGLDWLGARSDGSAHGPSLYAGHLIGVARRIGRNLRARARGVGKHMYLGGELSRALAGTASASRSRPGGTALTAHDGARVDAIRSDRPNRFSIDRPISLVGNVRRLDETPRPPRRRQRPRRTDPAADYRAARRHTPSRAAAHVEPPAAHAGRRPPRPHTPSRRPPPPTFWRCARAGTPSALRREFAGDPVRVVLLGEPIVIWRDSAGAPHALRDLCVHRGTALSLGRVVGDRLMCPYHGWQYRTDGVCALIPQLADPTRIPARRGSAPIAAVRRSA